MSTLICLGKFLKWLDDEQSAFITKGSIYHIKHMYIQPFCMEVDWQEIWHLMDVSTMLYICRYCVFTLWGRNTIHYCFHYHFDYKYFISFIIAIGMYCLSALFYWCLFCLCSFTIILWMLWGLNTGDVKWCFNIIRVCLKTHSERPQVMGSAFERLVGYWKSYLVIAFVYFSDWYYLWS